METSDYAGFVRDVKTGAILGIQNKRALTQIENDNKKLIKTPHKITHIVLGKAEGIKAYIAHYNKVHGIETIKTIIPTPVKVKPGRKPNKK